MPQCLKCGTALSVNEEGIAPVLCDNCAGRATSRARRSLNTGTMRDYPVTTGLIAVNVVVYAAMLASDGFTGIKHFNGHELIRWGGNFEPLVVNGDYWRLLTSCFIHGDFMHIAFNMWALLNLGQLCERLFGRWQTVAIYLLTGAGGALLSIASSPGRLSVGASGAIFGIGGAVLAGVKFGNTSIPEGQKRSIVSSLIFFVGVNFMLGMSGFNLGGATIDNMAHLGGFVTGLLIGLPLGVFAHDHKMLQAGTVLATILILCAGGYELVQKRGQNGLETRIEVALELRDYPKAISLLEKYTTEHPDDDTALVRLGIVYERAREHDKAIATVEKALKVNPNSADAKEVLEQLRTRAASDNQ
jgi:rhomboid protease GluP